MRTTRIVGWPVDGRGGAGYSGAVPGLRDHIRQGKPLPLEVEVFLNLLRSADALSRAEAALLKSHGLGVAQYNALRILRGAGGAGLTCGEIGTRMIAKDPDVTRLLDRLSRQGLVTRARGERDRRAVTASITARGRRLLARLDGPLDDLHRRQLAHLSRAELRTLSRLLERAREPLEQP